MLADVKQFCRILNFWRLRRWMPDKLVGDGGRENSRSSANLYSRAPSDSSMSVHAPEHQNACAFPQSAKHGVGKWYAVECFCYNWRPKRDRVTYAARRQRRPSTRLRWQCVPNCTKRMFYGEYCVLPFSVAPSFYTRAGFCILYAVMVIQQVCSSKARSFMTFL